jgi:hypothetical protein
MTQKVEFRKETHKELYEQLNTLNEYLRQVISFESKVIKLQQHPIKSWQEYFSNDLYCEMINEAHLMLGEKEINELYDDFKNSRNNELKKLIFITKNISDELILKNCDPILLEDYRLTYKSSFKDLTKHEVKNLKFLREI